MKPLIMIIISMFSFSILMCQEEAVLNTSLEDLLNVKISTAAKYEQTLFEVPASTTVVTSEDIERYNLRTLTELLQHIKGFFTRDDRNYSYFGLRGFDRPSSYSNNNLLLINGHILNENIYWQPFIGNDLALNTKIIDRVEIIRGPGSALYGAGAMLSVINIITKKGISMDQISMTGSIGSYDKKELSVLLGKELATDLDFTISGKFGDIGGQDLYFSEYDSPETNNGWAKGLDWEKFFNFYTTLTYKEFELSGFYTSREKAIPTASWETEFNNHNSKTRDTRAFIDLKYNSDISNSMSFKSKIFLDYYKYQGTYPYETLQHDSNEGLWLGGEFQYIWDIFANNRLIAGVEARHSFQSDYKLWSSDSILFDDNFPYTILSFYIQDSYQIFENLGLTLGIRHDNYSTVGSSTSPRLALIYNPTKTSALKALVGQAFRAPNIYEVEYEDFSSQKGNKNLLPEKILNSELVFEQEIFDDLFFSSSLFYYEVENLIDQFTDSTDGLLQFQNRNNAIGVGFDAEFNLRTDFGLWSYINYTHQILEDKNTKEKLTNSPRHIMKFGASYNFWKSMIIGFESILESERKTIFDTDTKSYFLTNLILTYKPKFENGNSLLNIISMFSISMKINNLFDVEYSLPGGYEHKQKSIMQNGRNFILDLNFNF